MFTVMQNAYLKKASQNKNFSTTHQNVLAALLNEKKYFTREELLCFSSHNQLILEKILKDLEQSGTIIVEGWLVKLKDFEDFNKEICEELI